MFVVVQHKVSNPEVFWDTAKKTVSGLPNGMKVHNTFPNATGTQAICLWEAESIEAVRNVIEPAVGEVSKNEYFAVEKSKAIGLPG